MPKTRTFIAVEASAVIRDQAAALAGRLGPLATGVRWASNDGLHYTLQFLGDITDQEIAEVCSRVGAVARAAAPFALEARGVGAFPSIDRPRTLWIGAGQGGEQLAALQQQIETSLADLGFRGENRRYVPHLTIGKTGRAPAATELQSHLAELADHEAGAMTVNYVVVFASELRREGPEYHALARCPLGG